ncbi:O-antigen ligase family protein [Bacteroides graminisolvens]
MMQPNLEYPAAVRFLYMAIIYVPLFKNQYCVPIIITSFYWISFCSFTALIPFSIIYTLIIVYALYLSHRMTAKISPIIIFSFFYYFFISLIYWDFDETAVLWAGIIITMLLSSFISTERDLILLSYAFVIVSFAISTVFLIHYQEFMQSYIRGVHEMERSGWMNPNMTGATIGCGMVFTLDNLLSKQPKSKWLSVFLIFTLGISMLAIILNASRGSLAAVLCGCGILLFVKREVKKIYKIIIIIIIIGLIYYANQLGYFDLLLFRSMEEGSSETGGGRLPIWELKINVFEEKGFFSTFFGVGQLDCISIGKHIRTHNDFVTAFISYGWVGLILFVIVLFYPIFYKFSFKKLAGLLPFFAFLLIECNVLEPLFRGYFLFIVLFMYIFKYSKLNS